MSDITNVGAKMSDFAVVLYTHSDCKDVYEVFFEQFKKHFNSMPGKKYICINNNAEESIYKNLPPEYIKLKYEDSATYSARLSSCLQQVEETIILYLHEDMILYNDVDHLELLSYILYLQNQDRDSFIKLIKGGEKRDIPHESISSLKRIPIDSDWIFSVQPSLWKRSALYFITRSLIRCGIYDLENRAQIFCKNHGIEGNYSYQEEPARGGHFDCKVFPYIATAIVRGKWNTKEYSKELLEILPQYNIDISIRGEFK